MIRIKALLRKEVQLNLAYLLHADQALLDKKLRKKFFMQLMLFALIGLYGFILIKPLLALYETYSYLGLEQGYLGLGLMSFAIIILVFNLSSILSRIYMSKDVETMLSLPIKAEEILFTKLFTLSISSLLYGLVSVYPVLLKFGYEEGRGLFYYIYGLLGPIFISMGLMAFLAVFIILFMLLAARIPRLKNIIQFLGLSLLFVLSFGLNFLMQRQMNQGAGEVMEQLALGSEKLMGRALTWLPSLNWQLRALEHSQSLKGFIYFLLLTISGIGLLVLVSKLMSPAMVRGVLASSTVVSKKKRKRVGRDQVSSVAFHLFKKEFLDLLRTPIYAFNTLGSGIIFPLIFLMPYLAQRTFSLSEARKLRNYLVFVPLSQLQLNLLALILGFVLGVFMGSFIIPLSSSFSREGKRIWLMKTLPIRARDQILGRLMVGIAIQGLGLLPLFLVISFILLPPIELIISLVLGSLLAAIPLGLLGLTIDGIRPKLVWDSPQEAMKQNLNVLFSLFTSLIYLAAQGYLLYQLDGRIDYFESFNLIAGLLVLLQVLVSLGLYGFLKMKLNDLIYRMEA